jgi:hypothetical protein
VFGDQEKPVALPALHRMSPAFLTIRLLDGPGDIEEFPSPVCFAVQWSTGAQSNSELVEIKPRPDN